MLCYGNSGDTSYSQECTDIKKDGIIMTLYGDGDTGRVIELGDSVSQPWRCEWKDEYGKCNNPKHGKHYCAWHEIILEETDRKPRR